MNIIYENSICWFKDDPKSRVFQIIPNCFNDKRGYFMEVMKNNDDINTPDWLRNMNWVKQINRSCSAPGVIRGCHAQKGEYCQGKMVEAINELIYDIITDTRPESKTFGNSTIFILDPVKHNKLWVPRGFLHAFVVPFSNKKDAIFEYMCDNVYNHSSETGVNPTTLLPEIVSSFKEIIGPNEKYTPLYNTFAEGHENVYSEKDTKAMVYMDFINSVREEYNNTGRLWYK